MTRPTNSLVDFMAQPSHNHEPADTPDPTATLLTGDEFNRKIAWGVEWMEPDVAMGRMYACVGGRVIATELDVA